MAKPNETTRERILLAAEKLVMAKGFTGTTIDDILKEAKLTKGAFFYYFKGKADLASALIKWHTDKDLGHFEQWMIEAEAFSDDPLEQMIHFLEAFEKYIAMSDDPSPGCMYAA